MLRIEYPNGANLITFKNDYFNQISPKLDTVSINGILNSIKGNIYTIENILTSTISELIDIYNYFKNRLEPAVFSKLELNFNYDINSQPLIADFFSKQEKPILESCFYCNMEYIHSFKDFGDYEDGKDFLNRAHDYELVQVPYITTTKLKSMRDRNEFNRPYNNINDAKISKTSKDWLLNYSPKKNKNHFTLDHVLPKGEYKLLSLSLFNFVPCCFACNSKFKRSKEFSDSNSLIASPSSKKFSIDDDFEFYLEFEGVLNDLKVNTPIKLAERIISNIDVVNEFFWMFKIPGRYLIHKREAVRLIRIRNDYPDDRIEEIQKLTKTSEIQIKKDLFGDELYDKNLKTKPLVKFRRDIARSIGINGII